jgi:alpha-L-rhamnosidase
VSATMPSPKGLVEVEYTKRENGWSAVVTLPEGLPGELDWGGKVLPLHEGKQTVRLE